MKNTKSIPATNMDEYIFSAPENVRSTLEKIRQTIRKAAPEAEEMISYGVPAFRYYGMLVYFAAFKNHCSFFVGNSSLVKEMKDELATYKTAPGTIHFTIEKPLPSALIGKIVKIRMKENLSKKNK